MHTSIRLPDKAELRLDHLIAETTSLTLVVETIRDSVPCPDCQQLTRRIHSRYSRTLADWFYWDMQG